MKSYIEQIEAALKATVVHSPFTFSWFGKRPPSLPLKVRRALPPEAVRSYLLATLQGHLYTNFYCKGFAAPVRWEADKSYPVHSNPLVEELSRVNSGMGYWDDDWLVRLVEGERIVASKEGITLSLTRTDCQVPNDTALAPGVSVAVHFPREFRDMSPGFYLAAGNLDIARSEWQQVVRLYWNATGRGSIRLMHDLTGLLNEASLPFKLKVLKDLERAQRCDAVVLYIRKSDYVVAREALERTYGEVAGDLRQATPVFTKPLADGLGLAEEPGQGSGFGLHRCQVLADGMLRAYDQHKASIGERLAVVMDRFAEEGIDLDKPYLNRGSEDIYRFEPAPVRSVGQIYGPRFIAPDSGTTYSTSPTSGYAAYTYLQVAADIALSLCREATWYQDRCNWSGATAKNLNNETYGTLGPDLYAGTSGVGLFLAELYATLGDARIADTALGATRHALHRGSAVPADMRLGLYNGWIGIALAATRVGLLLGTEEFSHETKQLVQAAAHAPQPGGVPDIISGHAGAIAGLVVLHSLLDDPSLLDLAARLGEELLATAVTFEDGISWKTINRVNEYHLTGFSHGTAGIAYALLLLFVATQDPRYGDTARRAFNYERYWFDATSGNWPDLREALARNKRGSHTLDFSTFWCHGAPGIALSRLLAYEVLEEEVYKAEALIALQTTSRMLESELHGGNANFSLCHGLAGNAEILLTASQVLGPEFRYGAELAAMVAQVGIDMYAAPHRPWPCGAGGGRTPNLMLGTAGIGHFYLRLHDPGVPSILMVRAADTWKHAATAHAVGV